jgi:hypothetical protein
MKGNTLFQGEVTAKIHQIFSEFSSGGKRLISTEIDRQIILQ